MIDDASVESLAGSRIHYFEADAAWRLEIAEIECRVVTRADFHDGRVALRIAFSSGIQLIFADRKLSDVTAAATVHPRVSRASFQDHDDRLVDRPAIGRCDDAVHGARLEMLAVDLGGQGRAKIAARAHLQPCVEDP